MGWIHIVEPCEEQETRDGVFESFKCEKRSNKKMKCFYHSADLDGHCSGAIVKLIHPICKMYPINYGDDFPWEEINQGERVFMVDFSLQPFEQMAKLASRCDLTWIDHHKSAIEDHKNWNNEHTEYLSIKGVRKVGIGACSLVWGYLFPEYSQPDPVKRIAEYDVWNHKHPFTLPFQYGARMYDTDPSKKEGMLFWRSLLLPDEEAPFVTYSQVVKEGAICLKFEEQQNKKACKLAFGIEFEGLKCVAINRPANSKVFESVWDPKKYDVMLSFYLRKPDQWTVNLFTDKPDIDVSEIAKKYGGGGHRGAAGFQCSELPFVVTRKVE